MEGSDGVCGEIHFDGQHIISREKTRGDRRAHITRQSQASQQKQCNVYFADPAANRIYKSDADRKVTLFKDNSSGAVALATGPDGRLYASQPARKRIVA